MDLVTFDEASATRTTDTPVVLMAGDAGSGSIRSPKTSQADAADRRTTRCWRSSCGAGGPGIHERQHLGQLPGRRDHELRRRWIEARPVDPVPPRGSARSGRPGRSPSSNGTIEQPFVVMNSDLLTAGEPAAHAPHSTAGGRRRDPGVREYVVEIPFGVVNLDGTRGALRWRRSRSDARSSTPASTCSTRRR